MKETEKNNRLENYEKEQWEKRLLFESELESLKDELYDGRDIRDIEPEEFIDIQNKLKRFVNREHPERGYFVKYNNFILDIRKPSCMVFFMFLMLSLIGIIQVIKFLFFIIS